MVICKECEEPMVKRDDAWYCQTTACSRFSLPCSETHGDYAYTQDEYDEAAQADGESREERNTR